MGQSNSTDVDLNAPSSYEEDVIRRQFAHAALNNPSTIGSINLQDSENTLSYAEVARIFFRLTWHGLRNFFIRGISRNIQSHSTTIVRSFPQFDRILSRFRNPNECYELEILHQPQQELQNLNELEINRIAIDTGTKVISSYGYGNSIQLETNIKVALDLPYLSFPFLVDDNAINWIRSNHVMFILRGLPGSGKSTVAKALNSVFTKYETGDFIICSADDFFMIDGSYNFDIKKLGHAHEDCQDRMKEAVLSRIRTIVIDNTNVRYYEMKPYIQTANHEGYFIILVEPKTPWRWNAATLAERNTHGVQKEIIEKRLQTYVPVIPLYFAWFLSSYNGKVLKDLAKNLLQLCLMKCDKFKEDFEEFSGLKDLDLQVGFYERRNWKNSQDSRLHCTAKYCGKHDPDVLNYSSKNSVNSSLGQLTKLTVVGFVITKSTFGARLKLSDTQLQLYEQNDYEKASENFHSTNKMNSSFEYLGVEEKKNIENIKIIERTTNFCPVFGKGQRAHITLGTAPGIYPVQTGLDLLEAVEFEKNSSKEKLYYNIFTYLIPETTYVLRRYRNDLWVLYKSGRCAEFDALFTGYYI